MLPFLALAAFSRASLSRAALSLATLSRADLLRAALSLAALSRAALLRAILSLAALSRASLSLAALSLAVFSRIVFSLAACALAAFFFLSNSRLRRPFFFTSLSRRIAFVAFFSPFACACLYSSIALFRSCFVPTPCSYISPNFIIASELPLFTICD